MPEIEATRGGLRLQLDEQEAGVLRELVQEMRLLLEADIPPTDDVLQRLFPQAHEDELEQKKYEELLGEQLLSAKLDALRTVEEKLGREDELDVVLTPEEADDWLRLMNDVRLAIGTRLEVDEVKMGRPYDPSDPEAPALSVLHWLGWLQGSILEELTFHRTDDDDASAG